MKQRGRLLLSLGAIVNPQHIVQVVPRGPLGCSVHLLAGPRLDLENINAEDFAERWVDALNAPSMAELELREAIERMCTRLRESETP